MFKADAAGIQLCTHVIGDRAISIILDLYGDIVKSMALPTVVCIEHAQHMAAKTSTGSRNWGHRVDAAFADRRWSLGGRTNRARSRQPHTPFVPSRLSRAFGVWYRLMLPFEPDARSLRRVSSDVRRKN
jgi:hypothetical protein